MKYLFLAIALWANATLFAQDEPTKQWTGARPDGHAPISIMSDHTHSKGGIMFSYRYMYMNMEGLRSGTDDATTDDALANYMVTPTSMPMGMHMLGAMYAPTDNLTLAAMTSYVTAEMEHLTRMGGTFTTESNGLGDLKLLGIYKFHDNNAQQWHAKFGFSLPTGVIDQMDATPASSPNEVILPYPMQWGSGTFDLLAGANYLWQGSQFSGGHQFNTVLRLGENSNDYRLGNRYELQNWVAYRWCDWISVSARITGLVVSSIEGANPDLNPMMVITADTANSGGNYINGGLGVNFYVPKGSFKNLRVGLEIASPLYQDLEGIQLQQKETFTAGIQYGF